MPIPADKWERVQELFQLAVELTPEKRAELLASACDGDELLRSEVESLLQFDQPDNFIESPAFSLSRSTSVSTASTDVWFGSYKVVQTIAEGGMGTVYLAARADDQYQKQVAIKLVKLGLDTEEVRRRFRHERQILAALDHPNIARLLDGGTLDDGRPYLVMEYVDGVTIKRYCDSKQLPIEGRLKLFLTVCSAVSYAHRNLVVHRDLKPSNVLVTADGTPKLLDFGIAKLLDRESVEGDDFHTITQLRVMTPEYASPEQARGEQVTTLSDVYSLGVLLFELLTGHRPYQLVDRRPDELARVICEQEPTRPSIACRERTTTLPGSEPKENVSAPPSVSWTELEGDLDNIILMSLRKEPERRYSSVEQFAEDLRRHLEGLPVQARKDTLRYRTAKFIQRNRVGVAIGSAILLALAFGVFAIGWQARVARRERDLARLEKVKAERINTFLQSILGFSDPSWLSSNPRRNRDATLSDALDEAARRAETELANEPEVLAAVRFTIGYTYRVQSRFAEAEPHLRASLDIRERVLGRSHQDTAQSMVGLAELYLLKGDYSRAEPLFKDALTIYRQHPAPDRKWLFITLGDYGLLQWQKGDLEAAQLLMREALDHSSTLVGGDRVALAVLYGNLGLIQSDRGNLDGALDYTRRAIELHRSLSTEPRFETGINLANLGVFLMLKGELDQAGASLQEALDTYRKTVGESHQYTAYCVVLIADLHYRRGEYTKAEAEANKGLELQARLLPEGHMDFARSWVVLGKSLNRMGKHTIAESYLRKALDKRKTGLKPGHTSIAEVQSLLGECLTSQRRYQEAEGLLNESYGIYKSRLGEIDPRTSSARERLVQLYEAWGRREDAARLAALP